MNLSINDAQKKVDSHIKQYEQGYWRPLALLSAIIEELGEVSRELMVIKKIKPMKVSEQLKGLNEELGDLFYSIICLANYYRIDLGKALLASLNKFEIRDKNRWG